MEGKKGTTDGADKKLMFSGREKKMRTWRGKMVFMFIVYFSGFATAIDRDVLPYFTIAGNRARAFGII